MTLMLGVVVAGVVFFVLLLVACLFILMAAFLMVSTMTQARRCESCRRWTIKDPSPEHPTICRSCWQAHMRAQAAARHPPAESTAQVVHDLLDQYRPRHHQTTHGETSP